MNYFRVSIYLLYKKPPTLDVPMACRERCLKREDFPTRKKKGIGDDAYPDVVRYLKKSIAA